MKTHLYVLCLLSYLLVGAGCQEKKPAATEKSAEVITAEPAIIDTTARLKTQKAPAKATVEPATTPITCEEKEEKNPEAEDPVIIKTCTFGKYRSITIGTPDYAGRYNYDYALFKLTNGKYAAIRNAALFNAKQNELLRQINERIKADYATFAADSGNKECFDGQEPPAEFSLDDLKIAFETDKVVFKVDFGFPSACRNVSSTSVAFQLAEIQPYLNK